MKIGCFLSAYREVNRLSLRELSDVVGISFTTLHRIEQNKPIDQATMLLLINWMFGGQEYKESPNTPTNKRSKQALGEIAALIESVSVALSVPGEIKRNQELLMKCARQLLAAS